MPDNLHKLKINKNCLGINKSGYIELPGVCRSSLGLARPEEKSFPGTYRELMEITAVYPTSGDIPTKGEVFDLANKISRYSKVLEEFGETPWEGSENDWIVEFPKATVFLMSKESDDTYIRKYPEQANDEQTFIMG